MSRRLPALLLLLSVLCLVVLPTKVIAESYDVNASVAFPAPTQPAVFTNSPNGTSVGSPQITLTGTCEALVPNGVVSIWRNGTVVGSAPCNGTFSVAVMLLNGSNTLVARSASISSQYGPDSNVITVTYILPPQTPPSAPLPAQPNEAPSVPALEAGIAANLVVLPTQAFGVMNTVNEVALDINVIGGRSPYTIRINWGDGSEETKVVDQLGLYRFTHVYAKPGTYTVSGVIRDVLGAVTTFSYGVVSERTPIAGTVSNGTPLPSLSEQGTGQWIWPAVTIGASIIVASLGFKLGLVAAAHQHISQLPKRRIK